MPPRRLPPLAALRAFEAAARLGGFARAAEELNLSPSAVSHQIRALEADLGARLFRRLATGPVLTEAGRAYLSGVADGLDRLARATAGARAREAAGRLSVSVLPSFAAGWLVPRLHRFRARCPEIDLLVRSELHWVDFAREPVDLALRYAEAPSRPGLDGLVALRLMGEDLFPVCSPALIAAHGPPRRLADLVRHGLIHDAGASRSEPWIAWGPWLEEAGLEQAGLPEAGRGLRFADSALIYQAAAAGLGVAVGRGALVRDLLASGRLVRPLGLARRSRFSYWAVHPAEGEGDPRLGAFLDWLLDEAAAEGAGG
jgi:LysR family glycine cleavage system transcriptional activator